MNNPLSLLRFKSGRQLPMMLQTEMAECGLACLAMVSSFHGHQIDLNTLRREYPISLRGANLQNIMETADKLGLNTRPLRLELDEMPQLSAPCILHWDMNHFVVLKKATEKGVVIHDPAQGIRTLTYEEASKHFTGVALECHPAAQFEQKDERQRVPFSAFMKRVHGLGKSMTNILLISLGLQVFGIVSPFYMQLVVDEAIVSYDYNLLVVLSIGFLLLALIQTAITALRSYVVLHLGNMLNIQMAANLFKHLLRLPLSYFEKRHIGDIVSRFGSLGKIKELLTTGIIEACVDGVMAILTLVMMFVYSPKLAFVVIGSVSIYAVVRFLWYRPLKILTEESIVAGAKENSTFIETIRAAQSIKIFSKESHRQTIWENRYADMLNTGIRVGRLGIVYSAINSVLFGVENILVIYLGASMVLDNVFSVGMLYAFVSYKTQFTQRASTLIQNVIDIRMLGLHLERLGDIALTPVEIPELTTKLSLPPAQLTGALKAKSLTFAYPGSSENVFENLSFDIKAGESVAIVGPSGCGKTTFMKVLMGLFESTAGSIECDGRSLEQITLPRFRREISSVMQNDQLLSGSLAENICFFDTHPDQSRIEASATIAAIHEDITKLPMGYNTLIGDMGTTLSGGQKQRVLLARALYAQPKILFLDEATSHLDIRLEKSVSESIQQLNITRIIVAHRPETIRSVERVFALTPEGLIEQKINQA
jgi:ATP-binding cassette subfamily B protein RaxB